MVGDNVRNSCSRTLNSNKIVPTREALPQRWHHQEHIDEGQKQPVPEKNKYCKKGENVKSGTRRHHLTLSLDIWIVYPSLFDILLTLNAKFRARKFGFCGKLPDGKELNINKAPHGRIWQINDKSPPSWKVHQNVNTRPRKTPPPISEPKNALESCHKLLLGLRVDGMHRCVGRSPIFQGVSSHTSVKHEIHRMQSL